MVCEKKAYSFCFTLSIFAARFFNGQTAADSGCFPSPHIGRCFSNAKSCILSPSAQDLCYYNWRKIVARNFRPGAMLPFRWEVLGARSSGRALSTPTAGVPSSGVPDRRRACWGGSRFRSTASRDRSAGVATGSAPIVWIIFCSVLTYISARRSTLEIDLQCLKACAKLFGV